MSEHESTNGNLPEKHEAVYHHIEPRPVVDNPHPSVLVGFRIEDPKTTRARRKLNRLDARLARRHKPLTEKQQAKIAAKRAPWEHQMAVEAVSAKEQMVQLKTWDDLVDEQQTEIAEAKSQILIEQQLIKDAEDEILSSAASIARTNAAGKELVDSITADGFNWEAFTKAASKLAASPEKEEIAARQERVNRRFLELKAARIATPAFRRRHPHDYADLAMARAKLPGRVLRKVQAIFSPVTAVFGIVKNVAQVTVMTAAAVLIGALLTTGVLVAGVVALVAVVLYGLWKAGMLLFGNVMSTLEYLFAPPAVA